MNSAMRFVAVAAVLAGLTSAQTLPACANTCVTQYTSGSQIGGCNSIDIVCICSNKNFISGIACCLSSSCDEADQEAATTYALNFCKAAGVTGLPTAVSCTSTAASTASTASSSTSATGAVTTTISSGSSASSSASASGVSQSVSSVSSASSSISSTTASVSSKASSQASSASSSTSSAATSATNNASPQNVAGLGAGVLGGLAVAVALL